MASNSVISEPFTSINIIPAQQKLENSPHRTLIIGQGLSAGSFVSGDLVAQVQNNNDYETIFGEKSLVSSMIRAFKDINQVSRLDVIGLSDNGSGVAATAPIVFSGTATEAGTLIVTVGSDSNHKYSLSVSNTDTASIIGDNLVSLIGADSKVIVSSVNTAGSVAITALNAGTEGNDITLRVTGTVAGVTYTVTQMTGGANNPSLVGLFDPVQDTRYQTIIYPYSFDQTTLINFVSARFNADDKVLDGLAIVSGSDTFANLFALGGSLNEQSLAIQGFNIVSEPAYKGSSMVELGAVVSSRVGAIRSLRLTDGANISRYVISSGGSRDSFGGSAIASLPYANTPVIGLPLIPAGKGFDGTEIKSLNDSGISTIGNNTAGNETIMGRFVTTYKNDSAGNPDISYKFVNYVDTIVGCREYMLINIKKAYAQTRLTNGDIKAQRNIANEDIVRSYIKSLYIDLGSDEFLLVQSGAGSTDFFDSNLIVSLDLAQGKVSADMKVAVITQLREFIGTIQIAFSTEE